MEINELEYLDSAINTKQFSGGIRRLFSSKHFASRDFFFPRLSSFLRGKHRKGSSFKFDSDYSFSIGPNSRAKAKSHSFEKTSED